ncbi:hypothetical protein Bca4012_054943 [Brassica carinata]|uniref:Uncharacterized protein n=1 Tax=Brassica carinata TaxID=52824 RepID=A0A8X7VY64_BRACI|nr:hypothetical protein Bca52824_012066 [Brassica carinata]
MNIKKKGKVHPSPPPPPPPPLPSFPSSSSKEDNCLSVLKLLPAVILLLVSSLSPDDKQVLAYLITRSSKTTTTTTTTSGRRNSSRSSSKSKKAGTHQKAPVFDCECFDCYTSYWLRWDSSPNRELIHQIIEAYEDHLTAESEKPNGRGRKKKRKEKSRGRRGVVESSGRPEEPVEPVVAVKPEEESPEMLRFPVAAVAATRPHKGLARKLLPDVMGLFNWRFWRLWNPNA